MPKEKLKYLYRDNENPGSIDSMSTCGINSHSFQNGYIHTDHSSAKLCEYSMKYLTSSDYDSRNHSSSITYDDNEIHDDNRNTSYGLQHKACITRQAVSFKRDDSCDSRECCNSSEGLPLMLVSEGGHSYIGPERIDIADDIV